MTPDDLLEIDAIQRLKHRYMRCIDLKLYDELAGCFAEDASSAYDSGRLTLTGRDTIVSTLSSRMGRPSFVSCHRAIHPEIELLSPTTAKGTWLLVETVQDLDAHLTWHAASYYHDEYRKIDGRWHISFTSYQRLFEGGEYLGGYGAGIRRYAAERKGSG